MSKKRQFQRRFLFVFLLLSLFLSSLFNPAKVLAANAACASNAAAQNGITVVPSHGSGFYIDTGSTPQLDAGYIGYRVTNSTGTTQANLWVQVSNFTGGVISLSNPVDTSMLLSNVSNNSTSSAYFLFKASGATTTTQTHTVKVFNTNPDLSGSSPLYVCDYSFTKVVETQTAGSNKIIDTGYGSASDAIEVSNTNPELGQTVTVTVEGQTGTIGSGTTSPDGDIVWLSPASVSTWPTRVLRLENVSVTFERGNGSKWTGSGNSSMITYANQLLIPHGQNCLKKSAILGAGGDCTGGTGTASPEYRATYTFRVVGRPKSSIKAAPISQIASGTQIKHADPTSSVDLSFSSLAINATLTKSVTATSSLTTCTPPACSSITGGINGTTYVEVPYRLTSTSTTATNVALDDIVDVPGNGVIFKSGSASVTDVGRTAVAIADPIKLSSESTISPQPYHFVGPFNLNSSRTVILNYKMWVPTGTYVNTTYAKIGDLLIGANSSAMSKVTVVPASDGSTTVEVSTQSFPVLVNTDTATGITSTAATLNGTVDPNGETPLTGSFEYGTSPTLSVNTSVTATTPTSGTLSGLSDPTSTSVSLTGLSVNTTYYYRAVAGSTKGTILSFKTLATQASPTVTTDAVSGVSQTGATLNGTINPNLTAVNAIQFVYGTSSTLASGNTTVTLDDGAGTVTTANGSTSQPFSTTISGLTGGTTYYYRIKACTTYSGGSCSVSVDGSIVSFVAIGAPTVTSSAASSVGSSIATLNGLVTANYGSTTATFIYGTSADLSTGTTTVAGGTVTGSSSTPITANIIGLSPSTTYYFRAAGSNSSGSTNGSILNFTTSSVNRTLTIDSGSYTSSYIYNVSPPTITSTVSSGTGTKSYTSFTASVCTIGSSSGIVTFVTTGTCTIGAAISASGGSSDASSPTISFTITAISRTLTVNSGSYASSYVYTDAAPTISATATSGDGTISYSSSTESICTINSSSGVVTFVDVGTCTLSASISSSNGYAAVTSSAISFTISATPTPTPTPTPTQTPSPDTTSPIASDINVTSDNSSVTVTWSTDELSSSQIEYGYVPAYGFQTSITNTSPRVTSHSISINGLKSCARVFYRVISTDSSSNQGISSRKNFATTGCITGSIKGGGEGSIDKTIGGSVSMNNGNNTASISVPTNFATQSAYFQLNSLETSNAAQAPTNKNLAGDNLYDLIAVDSNGDQISTFTGSVTFTIDYGTDLENSYDETTLDVYKYNGTSWDRKNCTVNASANTLTCSLPSFSVYGVFGVATSSTVGNSNINTATTTLNGASTCTSIAPVDTPSLFQINSAGTYANIYFTTLRKDVTGYIIYYGTSKEANDHSDKFYYSGPLWVYGRTIKGLIPNTSYYYKVQPFNDCSTGKQSNLMESKSKGRLADITQFFTNLNPLKVTPTPPKKEKDIEVQQQTKSPDNCSYKIKLGDSLWSIASQRLGNGNKYNQLLELNPGLTKKSVLRVGKYLAVCK